MKNILPILRNSASDMRAPAPKDASGLFTARSAGAEVTGVTMLVRVPSLAPWSTPAFVDLAVTVIGPLDSTKPYSTSNYLPSIAINTNCWSSRRTDKRDICALRSRGLLDSSEGQNRYV